MGKLRGEIRVLLRVPSRLSTVDQLLSGSSTIFTYDSRPGSGEDWM